MADKRDSKSLLRQALTLLFGGIAIPIFIQGYWLLGALCIVADITVIALAFDLGGTIAVRRSRSYAGIRMVVPVAPLDHGHRNEPETVERNSQAGTRAMRDALNGVKSVDLLLASGFNVIGRPDKKGWLYDELDTRPDSFKLCLLLLDPDCDVARRRARRVMTGADRWKEYSRGARQVLSTIERWEDRGMEVEVKLYHVEPLWQMMRTPDELWLFSAARHLAVQKSPMYVFRRGRPYGLSWGFEAVWDMHWDTVSEPIDLREVANRAGGPGDESPR